jgi:hypothetical protein
MMIIDLQKCLKAKTLPSNTTAIVAVGGIPTTHEMTCFDTPAKIKSHLTKGLGLGGMLTYGNPKDRTLDEMGALCVSLDHRWTEHALSLTLIFVDAPICVRNAFAFDGRFHLSWAEKEVNDQTVTFTAAGSVKNWRRMKKKSYDKSFKQAQRAWFRKVEDTLVNVLP